MEISFPFHLSIRLVDVSPEIHLGGKKIDTNKTSINMQHRAIK